MRRNKGLFGSAHYREEPKEEKKKETRRQADTARVALFAPGQPGLPEKERQKLREAQTRKQEPMEEDARRVYENSEGKNFSEPHILPPRNDIRKPNALKDIDLEDDTRKGSLPVIAEISAEERTLSQVDNQLSDLVQSANNMAEAVRALFSRVKQDLDDVETAHHVEQMEWIITEAIQPWIAELDAHFDNALRGTVEGETLEPEEEL